jgi:hypothetical protein
MLSLKTFMPFFKERLENTLKDLSNVSIDLKAKLSEGKNILLRQACELFLFHSLVLLRTQKGEEVVSVLELEKLVCGDNILPV